MKANVVYQNAAIVQTTTYPHSPGHRSVRISNYGTMQISLSVRTQHMPRDPVMWLCLHQLCTAPEKVQKNCYKSSFDKAGNVGKTASASMLTFI